MASFDRKSIYSKESFEKHPGVTIQETVNNRIRYKLNSTVYTPHKCCYKRRPNRFGKVYPGIIQQGNVLIGNEYRRPLSEDTKVKNLLVMIRKRERGLEHRLVSEKTMLTETSSTVSDYNTIQPRQQINFGFEQLGDTRVFKRTRNMYRGRPSLTRWPSGFELNGEKLVRQTEKDKNEKMEEPTQKNDETTSVLSHVTNKSVSVSVNSRLPPLPSPRSEYKGIPSPAFYSDFGLKNIRTDAFSGYQRPKKRNSKVSEEVKRKIEQNAERHIYACQVLSNGHRGSRAVQSVMALRDNVCPQRSYVRSAMDEAPIHKVTRHNTFLDGTKKSSYALVIKTRVSESEQRKKKKADPLPEISGHTLILGIVDK